MSFKNPETTQNISQPTQLLKFQITSQVPECIYFRLEQAEK